MLGIRIPFLAISALDDPVSITLLDKLELDADLCPQIAVYDAIPFQEFTQNPYTVLLTTSLGGHLSWFEVGGGRWHPRPVRAPPLLHPPLLSGVAQTDMRQICNFLNTMANEINLDAITPTANEKPHRTQFVTEFDPVRRKLKVLGR